MLGKQSTFVSDVIQGKSETREVNRSRSRENWFA